MKSLIFLLGVCVCAIICTAYAAHQTWTVLVSEQGMSSMLDGTALVQAIDQAAMESMTEKARAQFWGSLSKHVASHVLGKWK